MTRGRKEEIENIIILWTSLYAFDFYFIAKTSKYLLNFDIELKIK
jgi:hypothetical protein